MSACTLTNTQLPLANWKEKYQPSVSKAKPEFKNCQKPRKSSERKGRNEPRTKYLRAAFCEKDKMP